jgi:hypothetical protein
MLIFGNGCGDRNLWVGRRVGELEAALARSEAHCARGERERGVLLALIYIYIYIYIYIERERERERERDRERERNI